MSELRHLFTARSARPQLEAAVRALVQAAIVIASADGKVEEREVEALVDALRATLARLVGAEGVDDFAQVPHLLDEARHAMRLLARDGEPAVLDAISTALQGDLRAEALRIAQAVVAADGTMSDAETRAVERLRTSLSQRPA